MRAFNTRFATLVLRRQQTAMSAFALSHSRAWCGASPTGEKPVAPEGEEEGKVKEETVVSQEAYNTLEKQLEEAKKQIESLKSEVLYRAADAENARRNGREDVDKAKSFGITSFGKDMLEVADTLEKGLEAFAKIPEEELAANANLSSLHKGVQLSSKVLLKNLSKHGIDKMNVQVGTKFDHNVHEALARTPPTEKAPNEHVSHVMKDGYTIKSRVLRAAQVAVSGED